MHNEENTEAMNPLNPGPEQLNEAWGHNRLEVSKLEQKVHQLRREIEKVIIGQSELIDLLIASLLAGGHALIEGVPGIAKTLAAKLLAQTLSVNFSRIQFTPDLMPSDVLGTTVFNMKDADFQFNAGPIFSNIILIDEINRSPAKTQAALFEVMEEYQVTVDGETYPMSFPFFVMATQNPIEQEGTYKLPEAQLDRFLIKINLRYPSLEEEKKILRRFSNDFKINVRYDVEAVMKIEELRFCQMLVEKIYIKEVLLDYIAAIVVGTREHPDLYLGASPRASLALLKLSKALAGMNGRDFVIPEDIKYAAYPVLNHRVILTPEREMEGFSTYEVIMDIVEKIEAPR